MTQTELEAIKARAAAATPGPWEFDGKGDIVPDGDKSDFVAMIHYSAEDAEFIAHARADVPALVAEVERLRAENAKLDEMLDLWASGEMEKNQ